MLNYALYFIIYSFLGWVVEELYCSIKQRKLVIRGYLYGPLCPIYGVGAIMLIFFFSPYIKYWYLLFVISVILLSIFEYLTSYFMEKIFRMRWWDYSNHKFNINGRICLFNSVLFGGLAMLSLYVINPSIIKICNSLGFDVKMISIIVLYSLFIIDLIISTISHARTSQKFAKYLQLIKDDGKIIKDKIINSKFPGFFIRHTVRKFPKISNIKNKILLKEVINKIKEKKQKEISGK